MKNKGKIAICFLTTSNIVNLDIWEKWWKGNEHLINIYAHFSKKGQINQKILLDNRVKPVPTKWGDISLVNAEYQLYNKAYKNKQNKFFILVSATDIPVKSFKFVYSRLFRNINKGILPYRRVEINKLFKTDKENCKELLDKFGFLKKVVYAADQWKALSRNNVKDFLDMYKNKGYIKLFSDYCMKIVPDSLAPDELMFVNFLKWKYNNLTKYVRKGGITYVDFKGKAIHPLIYEQITNALRKKICDTDSMFARKFPNPNKKLIDQIPIKCK